MCSYREREREINIKLFYDLPGHFCCDCHKSFALIASQLRVKDQEVRIVEGPRLLENHSETIILKLVDSSGS